EFDPAGNVLNVWALDEGLLVKPRDEMIGKHVRDIVDEGKARAFEGAFARVLATGVREVIGYPISAQSGRPHAISWVVPVPGPDGAYASVCVRSRDVTALEDTEEKLRQLTTRLMHLQDEERRRTANILHETTAQSLLALKMNLTAALRQAVSSNSSLHDLLAGSLGLVEVSMQEIRTLSYLLHPPMLDEAGLNPALRWYAKGFTERSGILVRMEIPEDFGRLPRDIETTIFRIVQESLSNVHRHSGSLTARISIARDLFGIVLEIEDQGNGIGREPARDAESSGVTPGVGVSGMRERVRQLGGMFSISSAVDAGTAIRVTFPIEARAAARPLWASAAGAGAG